MSRPQSSDVTSSIACLEVAWSELSPLSAAGNDLPSPQPNVSSPKVSTVPNADEVASSISLHQKSNCSTSTFRYYGDTEDDVPHGAGIRIYTNSGSIGNSSNSFLPIPTLFSPPPSSHHDDASLNPPQKRANSSTGFSSV